MGALDGGAPGHVSQSGYIPMALGVLGDHSSLRMSYIRETRQLDPDCHEKAQGMIHLPPDTYLQPFPAQCLPLHHLGGLWNEQFPCPIQVGVCQAGFQHLAAFA